MAEPTEQEQIKQTQVLEKVAKSASDTTGRLDKVIASLKVESEEKDLLKDIKEQGEDKVKLDKASAQEQIRSHDKQEKFQKEKIKKEEVEAKKSEQSLSTLKKSSDTQQESKSLLETSVKTDEKSLDTLTEFKEESSEADKKQEAQNKFVKEQEKKKEALAKMSFNFTQRAAKLATRVGKDSLDWGKNKVKTVTRAVGSFFENLMKLLALAGLWLALSWLKGKNLKKMFDAFMEKVNKIMDEWIPQWVKDLSFGEAMTVAIASLVGGWLVLKGALASAGWAIRRLGAAITDSAGPKSRLNKQLINLRTKMNDLVARRNAIKNAAKMVDDLDVKSKLNEELKNTNEKIKNLEKEIVKKTTAMNNAEVMADALKDESKLSKELKKTNKALAKAAGKVNVATEAAKMAKNMSIDSKVGRDLVKANEEFVKLRDTQKMQQRQLRTAQYNIKAQKAGLKTISPAQLAEGYWVDKGGKVRMPGEMGATAEGFGQQKGLAVDTPGDGPKPKKQGSFMDRLKARVSGVGTSIQEGIGKGTSWVGEQFSKLGQTKIGKAALKGLGSVKALGSLATYATAILEPIRGAWAGWSGARSRGENVFESIMSGVGGGMHGFLDIIPMFIEFGELLAGAGINVTGWIAKALGADEKGVDAFITDLFGAYHKYTGMGTGKGLSGAGFGALDAIFGKFDKKTTIHGAHMATKGTDEERTIGDWLGLGKRADKVGGFQAAGEAWKSIFDLRTVGGDSMVATMQDPKKTKANREKWKKRMASGDEWLAENVPGVKWLNEAQVSVNEWKQDVSNDVQSLVETIKQQQVMFDKQTALIMQQQGSGSSVYNVGSTSYLSGQNSSRSPNQHIENDIGKDS